MKIKRYFAPDIKQAMRLVKEEQGPDAVILSNRKVDGGVEIVAARDFDEQTVDFTANRASSEGEGGKTLTESQRRAEEAFREALKGSGLAGSEAVTTEIDELPRTVKPEPVAATAPVASRKPAAFTQARKPEPSRPAVPAKKTSVDLDGGSSKALSELQRELRQMRRTLDAHFSESAWETAARMAPSRLNLLRKLSALGFSKHISVPIANRLGSVEDEELAWQGCRDLLAGQIPVIDDTLLDYGGIVALVGPTGVGKTTTIAKIAARFRLKYGPRQVALVTTDNFRIAAHEQLNTYGRLLDIPVRTAANAEELRRVLSGLYDKRLVLIDTAGMGPRDVRLAEQISVLRQDDVPIRNYLVLSAASQTSGISESIRAFSSASPTACILTKLDEAATLGPALSALIEKQLPIALVTDGQQVPEDLHPARTHLLLEQCLAAADEAFEDFDPRNRPFAYEDWVAHVHS